MPAGRPYNILFRVNFMTGISDGLVIPFAACIIAYPFFRAASGHGILLAGLLVSLAGAIVFGLARYFGELQEIEHNHPGYAAAEAQKELDLLRSIGIDKEIREEMNAEMEQERLLWLREIKDHELGWEHKDALRARHSGIHTGLGFFTGGLMVSLPFYYAGIELLSLAVPVVVALTCFVLFGWIKASFIRQSPGAVIIAYVMKSMMTSIAACAVAFFISRLQG
jgi:VIT1/CCC1 family predicted Fe2+/Mn2+ transporter